MPDGTLLVGQIVTGELTRVMPDGSQQLVASCGGGVNGVAIGPDGAAYICNNGGSEHAAVVADDDVVDASSGAPYRTVFEPTHGSAPKYEKLDPPIVNPIAMILSACMMLDHLGQSAARDRVMNAVEQVFQDGRIRTQDLGGTASTAAMGDAVVKALTAGTR